MPANFYYSDVYCFRVSFSCTQEDNTITVTISGNEFSVEVVRTPEERAKGLMFRKSLENMSGMLFVFEEDRKLSFWMKNTYIPLSIAYISKSGEIKEIYDMVPESLKSISSIHSVRYALELNKGAFEKAGIKVGDKAFFSLPPLR